VHRHSYKDWTSACKLKIADVGKSDGGSAFQVVLAEIASQKLGGPLIELLTFFFFPRRESKKN
jgi:hypothetical protein